MARLAFAFASVALAMSSHVALASGISSAEKAALQATMFKEIDRRMVDGKYLHFNPKTQSIKPLFPAKSHPMILAMGKHFILCTDFRTKGGKSVNVDFYVTRSKNSFVVFETMINKRRVVGRMLTSGRARVLK